MAAQLGHAVGVFLRGQLALCEVFAGSKGVVKVFLNDGGDVRGFDVVAAGVSGEEGGAIHNVCDDLFGEGLQAADDFRVHFKIC